MATIERMNIIYGEFIRNSRCFNVSKSVGSGQVNDFVDVMIVQALFDFANSEDKWPRIRLSTHDVTPPTVTGFFDRETQKAIVRFQRDPFQAGILGTMSVDGVIHPASLTGRAMRLGRKQMAIVELNLLAGDCAGPRHRYDHVSAMLERYPLLRGIVKDTTGNREGAVHLPI